MKNTNENLVSFIYIGVVFIIIGKVVFKTTKKYNVRSYELNSLKQSISTADNISKQITLSIKNNYRLNQPKYISYDFGIYYGKKSLKDAERISKQISRYTLDAYGSSSIDEIKSIKINVKSLMYELDYLANLDIPHSTSYIDQL